MGTHCQRRSHCHAREHRQVLRRMYFKQGNEIPGRVAQLELLPDAWDHARICCEGRTGSALNKKPQSHIGRG
jgi:hypothetical protein